MPLRARDNGIIWNMVLESEYIENTSGSDSGSDFDSTLDYLGGSGLSLYYLCSAFGELVFEVVVVVELEEAVGIVVGTEMVIGVVLLPHTDMDSMVEEPWEFGTVEHWLSLRSFPLIFS